MFNALLLNRLERAVSGLREDLKLKEQQDRIEAQETRIEKLLTEVLQVLDEREQLKAEARDIATELGESTDDQAAAIAAASSQVNQ